MTDVTEQFVEKARAAAIAARQAAEAAQGLADQLASTAGAAAHVATGGAVDPFVLRTAVFVLAVFVGYYVAWSIAPALHAPLMSMTSAIASVIIVGALLAAGIGGVGDGAGSLAARLFGFLALVLAGIGIVGGFMVTERMLAMHRGKEDPVRSPSGRDRG